MSLELQNSLRFPAGKLQNTVGVAMEGVTRDGGGGLAGLVVSSNSIRFGVSECNCERALPLAPLPNPHIWGLKIFDAADIIFYSLMCQDFGFFFFLSFFLFFLRSSIGGVTYVTVLNSSAIWAATFPSSGVQKCMLVIFVFP